MFGSSLPLDRRYDLVQCAKDMPPLPPSATLSNGSRRLHAAVARKTPAATKTGKEGEIVSSTPAETGAITPALFWCQIVAWRLKIADDSQATQSCRSAASGTTNTRPKGLRRHSI